MRVVVAKRPFKGHAIGSEIEVSAKDARVLITLGRAAPAAVVVAEVVAEPEPEQAKSLVSEDTTGVARRRYRRRDMSAEG